MDSYEITRTIQQLNAAAVSSHFTRPDDKNVVVPREVLIKAKDALTELNTKYHMALQDLAKACPPEISKDKRATAVVCGEHCWVYGKKVEK